MLEILRPTQPKTQERSCGFTLDSLPLCVACRRQLLPMLLNRSLVVSVQGRESALLLLQCGLERGDAVAERGCAPNAPGL